MSLPKQGINNPLFINGFGKTTTLAPVFSFLKNTLYLNVDVFCTKILMSSEQRKGLPECRAVPSFLCYFKTLSTCPGPRIEPAQVAAQVPALPTELILPRLKMANISTV